VVFLPVWLWLAALAACFGYAIGGDVRYALGSLGVFK
jgi:hypothetical protein